MYRFYFLREKAAFTFIVSNEIFPFQAFEKTRFFVVNLALKRENGNWEYRQRGKKYRQHLNKTRQKILASGRHPIYMYLVLYER